MAFTEAGLPHDKFQIDAADISAHAIARARRAVYGRNSFRGKELGFRDRYFRPVQNEYCLDPAICACVRFQQTNVLAEGLPGLRASYDIIFCRNLLIYFDPPTQQKALAQIAGLLAPAGVLFVGPAEQRVFFDHGFVSAGIPMAFACRKPPAIMAPQLDRPGSEPKSGCALQALPTPCIDPGPASQIRCPI